MAGGCDLSGENGGGTNNTKRMTIAFIGAKSVGKTSIIRQFVSNQFSNVVGPTVHPQRYATSLVLSNNRIVEIHISDFPAIDTFPEDSLQEWNLHCSSSGAKQNSKTVHKPPQSFCRLRQASAYVLVFDSSRPAPTFQYIRQMRDQILSHGGKDVYKKPMVVAANKQDLVHMARGPSASATSTWSNRGPLMKSRRRGAHVTHQQTPAHNNNNGMSHSGGGGNNGGKWPQRSERNIQRMELHSAKTMALSLRRMQRQIQLAGGASVPAGGQRDRELLRGWSSASIGG